MNVKLNYLKFFLSIILIIFSFYINYYYANKGLYPIDSFTFFDTGYYITQGKHPIKDFWVISGIFPDYIQAIFFSLFGKNWNSYIYHSSFFNILISLFIFFFLNQFNKNIFTNFFLSMCVGILCYPVVGTPFPYQHSFILSVISLLVFYLGVEKNHKIYWFCLPILMMLSFLSMQLPSGLINLLILIFLLFYLIYFDKSFIKYFTFGFLFSLFSLLSFIFITKINIGDLIEQLILFPLTVGEGRIISSENAFESAKLINKLTIRGTIGHFKFINFFILSNIFLIFLHIKNKKKFKVDNIIFLNIFVLICSLSFIFHQLITANQTFIFSLIPILCGLVIIQIDKTKILKKNKIFNFIIAVIIIFSTVKYHIEYNDKRKFMDLQNVNLSRAIKASQLDSRFDKLKWITPTYFSNSPNEELNLLDESLQIIKKDKSKKMLITHYQFFSLLLNEDLNIPNRWYYPNNTFPSSSENKYYTSYLKKFDKKIYDGKIKSIYVLETAPDEMSFLKFTNLLNRRCFQKEKLNKILFKISIINCS